MHKQYAFTLVELMVTLAVMAIVLAVALPSFTTQIQNNRAAAIGEEFTVALNLARSEAVKRGRAVTLCASNTTQNGCANDWGNGWLVAMETQIDTANTTTAGEVIRIWEAPADTAVISVQRADTDGSNGADTSFVRYTGLGTLARINGDIKIARVRVHSEGCVGDNQQEVTVGIAGLVRISENACP